MLSNRLAVVLVGGACLLSAAAGAFVATNRSTEPAGGTVAPPVLAAAPAAAPVHETEAVMEPPAATLQQEAEPAEPSVPRARQVPAERPAATARRAESTARRTSPPSAPERRETPRVESTTARVDPARVSTPETSAAPLPSAEPVRPVEPVAPPAPPAPAFDELTIPADSVIGLQIDNTVTTESAQVEDTVEARVTRDVFADGRVAVAAGARALGNVTLVERGGKFKERARLGVRFHTLVLADGTTLPIQTETVYRDGESPSRSSATKVGIGAVGGTIAGAIFGGTKGAVIGGAVGAAGGTAATMAGSRRAAALPAGSTVTVRVLSPVDITVER